MEIKYDDDDESAALTKTLPMPSTAKHRVVKFQEIRLGKWYMPWHIDTIVYETTLIETAAKVAFLVYAQNNRFVQYNSECRWLTRMQDNWCTDF